VAYIKTIDSTRTLNYFLSCHIRTGLVTSMQIYGGISISSKMRSFGNSALSRPHNTTPFFLSGDLGNFPWMTYRTRYSGSPVHTSLWTLPLTWVYIAETKTKNIVLIRDIATPGCLTSLSANGVHKLAFWSNLSYVIYDAGHQCRWGPSWGEPIVLQRSLLFILGD